MWHLSVYIYIISAKYSWKASLYRRIFSGPFSFYSSFPIMHILLFESFNKKIIGLNGIKWKTKQFCVQWNGENGIFIEISMDNTATPQFHLDLLLQNECFFLNLLGKRKYLHLCLHMYVGYNVRFDDYFYFRFHSNQF